MFPLFLGILQLVHAYSITCANDGRNECADRINNNAFEQLNSSIAHRTILVCYPEAVCDRCYTAHNCLGDPNLITYNNSINDFCTCRMVNISSSTLCWNKVLNRFTNCIPLIYNLTFPSQDPLPEFNPNPFDFSSQRKRQITNVSASFITPTLTVYTPDPGATFVFLAIGTWTTAFACGTPCIYQVPTDKLVTNGQLMVSVIISDRRVYQGSFPILSVDTCSVITCEWICMEYITHFVCYSKFTQVAIGLSFSISLLVILIILLYILKCFFNCWMARYTTQVVLTKDDSIEMTTPTQVTSRGLPLSMFVFLCILSLSANVNAQCTATTIISSDAIVCTTIGNVKTCDLTINTIASLIGINSQICAVILDSNSNRIGTLNITYLSANTEVQITPMYYTTKWNPVVQSNKFCAANSVCPLNQGCLTPSSVFSQVFSGLVTQWPGYQQCQASCGCAGCGCFFCSDACLYSAWALVPTSNIYQVFSLNSAFTSPSIRFSLELGGNITTQTFSLSTSAQTVLQNWTFTLIGNFQGASTIFGSQRLVVGSLGAFFANTADTNNPQWGIIGDVQSATTGGFLSPSRTGFIKPAAQVVNTASQDTVTYLFQPNGLNILSTMTPLPKLINTILWTYTGQKIVGANSQPGAVQFSFSTISPVRFSYTVTSICPVITPPSAITGCFDCPLGFEISIKAKSSCGGGSVDVSVQSANRITCFNPVAILTSTVSSYSIRCSSQDKIISGLLILKYGNNIANVTFNAVLTEPPSLLQQIIDPVTGNVTNRPVLANDFLDLWNSLTGTAAIAKYILVIIVGVVIISVLIALGVGFYYGFKATKDYREQLYGDFRWRSIFEKPVEYED